MNQLSGEKDSVEKLQTAKKTNEEEQYEFLFVDIEWNQKVGSSDVADREPIQIGVIGTDENFENVKLFSKSIRLDDVNTLTEQTCKMSHTNERMVMKGISQCR